MMDRNVKTPVHLYLASVPASCLCALVLLASPKPACPGQGPACSVAVTVQNFELSSFPKEYVERAVAWKQQSRARASGRPGRLDMGELGYATTDAWTPARDIPPQAFVVLEGRRRVPILSVRADSGPRRVVFIAENGTDMAATARKVEAAVITGILSKARAEDSFALLTARGPRVAYPLGSRRGVIEAAAQNLDGPVEGQSNGEGVLDALVEATMWLHATQPGDSILLLAMRIEGRNRASVSSVRAALGAGRIRLFGFQLGPKALPGVGDVLASSFAKSSTSEELTDGMFPLCRGTGGMAICEDTQGYGYRLKGPRLQELSDIAEQMYNAIAEYYVLDLGSAAPHPSISLSPEFQRQLLVPMGTLYARRAPPCSIRTAAEPETSW